MGIWKQGCRLSGSLLQGAFHDEIVEILCKKVPQRCLDAATTIGA